MLNWDEFCVQRRSAIERFVSGDVGPYKQLWSHADDVTIFGDGEHTSKAGTPSEDVWTGRPAGSARAASTSTTSRPARAVTWPTRSTQKGTSPWSTV